MTLEDELFSLFSKLSPQAQEAYLERLFSIVSALTTKGV